jgi:hypothetical protein
MNWTRGRATLAAICAAVMLAVAGCVSPALGAQPAGPPAVKVSRLSLNCQPAWVSGNTMIFNVRKPDGHWEAYIGNTHCQNGRPLLPPTTGHRGATDATPDGRYVVFETDRANPPGQFWAEPGKGYKNDIELLDRKTGRATVLATGRKGTIWASIKPDGSKVTWSEMVADPLASGNIKDYLLGIWDLHVADITKAGALTNEKIWRSPNDKGFMEAYGWFGNKIMFASDTGIHPRNPLGSWLSSQDWLIPESLSSSAVPQRVTQPFPKAGGGKEDSYAEFMRVAPQATFPGDPAPWLLTTILRNANNGVEIWRVNPDGTKPQQLTFFNGQYSNRTFRWEAAPGYPPPQYTVMAGFAVDRKTGKIYAGIAHDPTAESIQAWEINAH